MFFFDRGILLFSPKGKAGTRPDGRGGASQDAGWFIAAPSRREDSRPLPGPPIVPHPRKRLAASATGGAVSPIFSFWMRQKTWGPHKIRRFCGERRGKGTERSPRRRRGRSGVDFAPTTGRARSKREKALRLNIRGIPKRGRAESHRAVLFIYLPATGVLYCFAAGDEGVVHLSHAFLGSLLEPRLLPVPRLSSPAGYPSSFVLRPPSFVSRPSPRRVGGMLKGGPQSPLD